MFLMHVKHGKQKNNVCQRGIFVGFFIIEKIMSLQFESQENFPIVLSFRFYSSGIVCYEL